MKFARTMLATALQVGIAAGVMAMILIQRRVAVSDDEAERRKKVRPTPHSPPAWGKEPMA